jgi:hypothetical protein
MLINGKMDPPDFDTLMSAPIREFITVLPYGCKQIITFDDLGRQIGVKYTYPPPPTFLIQEFDRYLRERSSLPESPKPPEKSSLIQKITQHYREHEKDSPDFPKIICNFPVSIDDVMDTYRIDSPTEWRPYLGHTIPTEEALSSIVKFMDQSKKILSIGSGVCLWEYFLKQRSFDVITTDPEQWYYSFLPIEKISSEEAVVKYPTDALLLIWPTTEGWDAEALLKFTGDKFILVCDDRDKGRGDVCSQHLLQILERDWLLGEKMTLPELQEIRLYPQLFFYTRKYVSQKSDSKEKTGENEKSEENENAAPSKQEEKKECTN